MKYICLIYHSEGLREGMSEEDGKAQIEAYFAFNAEMEERGVLVGGDALYPVAMATSVRVTTEGQTVTSDGPFAETKEQLGGYYILDCKDLDEALECAAKIPDAKGGTIEVRPIAVFD